MECNVLVALCKLVCCTTPRHQLRIGQKYRTEREVKKLRKIGLVKRLGVLFVALTFIIALVPAVDAAQYRSTMNVSFNPSFQVNPAIPSIDNAIWVGTISGDIEGTMVFWATGPDPAKDIGHPPGFPWQVHFFTEYWEITTDDGWIAGIDKGNTGYSKWKNWKFRMNGEVTDASEKYADLIGHQVHMNGEIEWEDVFVSGTAVGPVLIN